MSHSNKPTAWQGPMLKWFCFGRSNWSLTADCQVLCTPCWWMKDNGQETSTRSDAPHSPLLKCRNRDPRLDVERCVLGRSSYRKPRWVKNWRVFYYYYYYLFFTASSFVDSVSESQVGGVAAWPFQFQHCTPSTRTRWKQRTIYNNKIQNPKTKARGSTHTNFDRRLVCQFVEERIEGWTHWNNRNDFCRREDFFFSSFFFFFSIIALIENRRRCG